jgi:hypothetical protein
MEVEEVHLDAGNSPFFLYPGQPCLFLGDPLAE